MAEETPAKPARKTKAASSPKAAQSGASARTRKKPAAKAAAPKEAPAPAAAATKGVTLRKKELVERVAAASGSKKKAVKEIVEATLKALGDALAAGETLALPPFGKAKVNRHRDTTNGEMLTVKVRRAAAGKTGPKAGNDTLAEAAD